MPPLLTTSTPRKTIRILHPDLGIGGAERLILDAALALQRLGHRVVIFTSHRDPQHCFDEARDGTLDVRVRGHTLVPASLAGGRFRILCAVARQVHLLLSIGVLTDEVALLLRGEGGADGGQREVLFLVDQLAAGLPVVKMLWPAAKVLFYCHFPDLLLVRGRERWWKRMYRVPFDGLEGWSMGFADGVCVNSGFTKGVVQRQWPGLASRRELEIVYPCVDVGEKKKRRVEEEGEESLVWRDRDVLLSINRFEKKKDVGLAIRAYAGLGKEGRKGVRLVVAGKT
jgi:alpha-1,3/alpha-1,6-mannosyltransferase